MAHSVKPNWVQSFKGATHILRVQDIFVFAIGDTMGNFKTEDGKILNNFTVIEEKPSNGPVSIANTFIAKPDWSLAFVGATHIISVNNLRLEKVTYHFAKKTGEKFANSVGTVFTNVTVVDDGDGVSFKQQLGRIKRIPMVTPVIGSEDVELMRERLKSFVPADEGSVLRLELHAYAKKRYVCKFDASQYISFMNSNECTFTINGSQETNHPSYFKLFTVVSQHVSGDCVEECLDKAINSQMTNLKPGRSSIKIPMVVPPVITDETIFDRTITVKNCWPDFLAQENVGAALSLLDELSKSVTTSYDLSLIETVVKTLKGEK